MQTLGTTVMKTRRALIFYTLIGAILQIFPVMQAHSIVIRFLLMLDYQGTTLPLLLVVMSKLAIAFYIIPFLFLAIVITCIVRKKSDNVFINILGAEVLTQFIVLFFFAGSFFAFLMTTGLRMAK